ncbi:MAG: hypothetical protein KA007_00225 [Candidatus Pacebacteria bacterium]|nr:hypothetical protein [Candidatus Paceibacterota bacterium]
MYYSIYDKQTGCLLETGLNSKSKKEAINECIDYLIGSNSFTAPSRIKRMSLKHKEAEINTHDFFVEEHKEREKSYFDEPEEQEDYRANNRSPFGIGS